MTPHAPYSFAQETPLETKSVLADAHRRGTIAEGNLGHAIYMLRKTIAETRRLLRESTPTPDLAYRTALLRDLARYSEHAADCTAALDSVMRCVVGEATRVRCARCHRNVPGIRRFAWVFGWRIHPGTLVMGHAAGSMFCTGEGEVVS